MGRFEHFAEVTPRTFENAIGGCSPWPPQTVVVVVVVVAAVVVVVVVVVVGVVVVVMNYFCWEGWLLEEGRRK